MASHWIEGCVVERVGFHDGLELKLGHDSELVISVAMRLTLPRMGQYPAEVVTMDATSVPPQLRPLLDIAGAKCTQASWDGDGNLHAEFSGGHQIDVPFSEHATAWELYGRHHGYIACLPRGDVRTVRYDLPQDAASTCGTVSTI